MGEQFTCCICGTKNGRAEGLQFAAVRSNVRRFSRQQFALWRCASCRSIHARDQIDLGPYYEHYPFKRQRMSWMLRRVYGVLLGRLRRAGLRKSSSILDYGCGSGLLVEFLRSKGYARAAGYDAYSEQFADPGVLAEQYDCLMGQDVIEHVEEPLASLRTFAGLVRPGGTIVIGTPNAEAIDLARPERFVHSLHQPYHRHVWSKQALLKAAGDLGWRLQRFYTTAYTNTHVPLMNTRFLLRYLRSSDNTVDAAFEPLKGNALKLLKPAVFFDAFFGSFFDPRTEMFAVFRTRAAEYAASPTQQGPQDSPPEERRQA